MHFLSSCLTFFTLLAFTFLGRVHLSKEIREKLVRLGQGMNYIIVEYVPMTSGHSLTPEPCLSVES